MRVSVLLLSLVAAFVGRAEVKIWTNVNSGVWSTPVNWSPNGAPSTNDIAVITNNGTYTVTMDANQALAGLLLGGGSGTQTLATAWQTFVLNGQGIVAPSGMVLFSGTLSGTNHLLLQGAISWLGGTVDASSVVEVAANGSLFVGGGANHARVMLGSLTNAGTITYAAPGPLGLAGPLHNLAGGLVDVQWDNSIFNYGPGGLFVNDGVLRKSAGAATAGCNVPLINSGVVETASGKLVLSDGSVFKDGSRFVGAGITLADAGTNYLNGRVYSENLWLSGASLTGTGTLSGTVTWGAGYIDYGAAVLIATNGSLFIGGGANYSRILRGCLTNAGTITYAAPGPFGLAGPLHNLVGGLVDVQWDGGLFNSGPAGEFVNEGSFRKSAGAGTTECQVPFLNRGTVDIPSGRLYFSGHYQQPSGDLLLRSGAFRSDQPLNLAGGWLTGWGTVEADLVNAGATIGPSSSNGVITVTGAYTQQIGGTVEFELGGTIPGTNLSHLKINGAAELSGTIAVSILQPYLPVPGDSHPVMSFSSRKGDFVRRNGLILLGHDRRLVTSYGPKTLSLLTVAEPDPTGVVLQIGISGNVALVSWPLEFGGGTLSCSTNLFQPDWVILPAPNNCFLDQPMAPQKYFRLSIP